MSVRFNLKPVVRNGLLIALLLVVWIWPAYKAGTYVIQQITTSTTIQARYWIVENLPPGSKIAQDFYAVPLDDAEFDLTTLFTLAKVQFLRSFYQEGFEYLIVSSDNYDRYLDQAEQFPEEANFYKTVFEKTKLIYIIRPDTFHGGPTIQVFKLPKRGSPTD